MLDEADYICMLSLMCCGDHAATVMVLHQLAPGHACGLPNGQQCIVDVLSLSSSV